MPHDKALPARERFKEFASRIKDPSARAEAETAFEAFCAEGQVAQLIKDLRAHLGLSQEEFASRLAMKQPFISRMERGGGGYTLATLNRIASAFNLRVKLSLVPVNDD